MRRIKSISFLFVAILLIITVILPIPSAIALTTSSNLTREPNKIVASPTPTVIPITPSAFNYTVEPNVFDLSTAPGTILKEHIKLYNKSTVPNVLKIQLRRINPDISSGNIQLMDFPPNDPSATWVHFTSTQITTPPQQWTTVNFEIDIPKDAAYGYYWAIDFSALSSSRNAGNRATVIGSVAVPILLVAQKSGINYSATFNSFDTDHSFYEYPPVIFRIAFSNQGNIHLQPIGNIFIKDWQGHTVATLNANPDALNVLPGGTRRYDVIWDDSFITDENKTNNGQIVYNSAGEPEKTPVIHFNKILDFRLGQYTATALLVVQTDKRDIPYQLTTSFFIFPWKIALGGLFIVILVLLGLTFSLRSILHNLFRIFRQKKA